MTLKCRCNEYLHYGVAWITAGEGFLSGKCKSHPEGQSSNVEFCQWPQLSCEKEGGLNHVLVLSSSLHLKKTRRAKAFAGIGG